VTTAAVSSLLRQHVDRWAADWLQSKFSRLLKLRALDPGPFNYPIEVFPEWRGKALAECFRAIEGNESFCPTT
jgi:hypothetical protein